MMLIADSERFAVEEEDTVHLERFIQPYYAFRDAGIEVVLASRERGGPWMGWAHHDEGNSEVLRRFKADRAARDQFNDMLELEQVYADDFDAGFCIGHPGPIWSGPQVAGALIAELLRSGKPVAVIASNLDLAPLGAGDGLLIVGDRGTSSFLAARALLGALGHSSYESGST